MNREGKVGERQRAFRRRSDVEKNEPGADELRGAIEASGLGIIDYYPLSGEMIWDGTAKKHFGLSPDAPVNYNVFLVGIHQDDRARVEQALHRALDGQSNSAFSVECRTIGIEDGKERRIGLNGRAFFNQWGEGARLIGTTRDMTESVRELRESDETFQTLFNSVYDGILLHATDGAIVDMNEQILSLYRVRREQLRRLTIEDISGPQNPLQDLPRIWAKVMAGEKQLFEWKARRPGDGSLFDVEVFLRKIQIRGRDLIFATIRDITERKRSIEAVRDNEQRLQAIFHNAALGIVEVDQEDRVVAVNDRLCEMLGYSREDLIGMTVHQLTAPEDRPLSDRLNAQVHEGSANKVDYEKRYLKRDGSELWVRVTVTAVRDPAGRHLRSIGTIEDIHERKRMEIALRESEERYRLLFDKSPLPKWVFDLETLRIREVNDVAVEHYGYSRKEFLELTLGDVRTPDEFEKLQEWAATCCAQGAIFEGKVQTKHRKKNGEVIDVELRYREITYEGRRAGLGIVIDITERRRSEEAVLRSRTLLAEAEKLSHTGAWEWDLMTDTWTFSDEWLRIHGTREKTLAPGELIAIAHPDDRAVIEKAFDDLRKGVAPYELEHRIVRQDTGETRMVRAHGQFMRDPSGRVVRVYGFAQDITEQKQAEARVEASRTLLETVVNYIPAALTLIKGSDLRLQLINPAYRQLAPAKVMVGRTLDEIWPETGQNFLALCRRVLETGEPYHAEDEPNMIRRSPDGPLEKTYFTWSLHRVRLPGNEGWGILNTAWETTERKRAEEELRESEERFRTLADNIAQFAWMADGKGSIFWYNKRWYDYTGTTIDEMRGWGWQKVHHPDHVARVVEKIRQSFERGEVWEDTFPLRGSDGTYRWFLSRAVPIRDDKGTIIRWFGTNTDITELRDIQEKLKQSVDELRRSNSELQQFAYVASHDLQEPLRTVGSYVELLSRRYTGKLDSAADKYISFVVEGANRMSQLINDLLAYSRVGTRAAEFESVDMNLLFENAVQNVQRAIEDSGAVVTADALPVVSGDPTQLLQLFQNLMGNAVKFRKPGRTPKIHVSAEQRGADWVFGVHDNGIGIEPRFFDRIFVIFQRLHTREEYTGTGIGLAICRRIVERHGGRIWVESKPDEGSTFLFSLPAGRV